MESDKQKKPTVQVSISGYNLRPLWFAMFKAKGSILSLIQRITGPFKRKARP